MRLERLEFGINWFPYWEWVEDWRYYDGGYWVRHDAFAEEADFNA